MDDRDHSQRATLPLELILEIITFLVSTSTDTILPASHDITKTLVALTQVCRATSQLASRLLRQRCVHIDSPRKAKSLAQYLARSTAANVSPTPSGGPSFANPGSVTALFLSPFVERQELSEPSNSESVFGYVTATDEVVSPLNDLPTATAVRDILLGLAPTLRRLVIDIPLRSLYPEDDSQGVRLLLRQGFESLVNLEELTSIQDELYLNVHAYDRDEPPVWATCWPKLRRLALYNPVVDPADEIWRHMARLPHLDMVIFARADASPGTEQDQEEYGDDGLTSLNAKKEWLDALEATRTKGQKQRLSDITIVFVDVLTAQPVFRKASELWFRQDPDPKTRVLMADAPLLATWTSSTDWAEMGPIQCTRRFLRTHAVAGTLWDEEVIQMYDANFWKIWS